MIYSKTLQSPTPNIPNEQHLRDIIQRLEGVPYRLDHPHRLWEYGIVLAALQANGTDTILEIGGGSSLFAPAAALLGMEVMQVDIKACADWAAKQEERLSISLPYTTQDFFEYSTEEKFDAVVSISVIEHTSADASVMRHTDELDVAKRMLFFKKMLDLVALGGLMAITTDFHPTKAGNIKFGDAELLALYEAARGRGFDWFGDGYDYTYAGNFVNYYTFASMVLRRIDGH